VQDYIARFGVRKCEANALVVAPDIGRQLCREAILRHVPAEAPAQFAGVEGLASRRSWRLDNHDVPNRSRMALRSLARSRPSMRLY